MYDLVRWGSLFGGAPKTEPPCRNLKQESIASTLS